MKRSVITGVGRFLPERIVTNEELSNLFDTTPEWIVERTGIQERRFFDPDKDTVASMAASASRMAMEQAGITNPKEIDFIVFATITPDYFFPGSGVLMQRELGMEGIGALDLRNACSGFIYALSVADNFIKTGMYKKILVVGAEIQTSAMELSDRGRNIAVIFGDGAGAVVLEAAEADDKAGILSTHLYADGTYAEELYIKDPGSSRHKKYTAEMLTGESVLPYMNGNAVFKHAIVRFSQAINDALNHNGLTKDDIDLLIPHQANLRISNYLKDHLKLTDDQVFNNIMHYGNTTAASIPIAMSEAIEKGKLKSGDLLCVAAFGSGFTWASSLIRMR
ncbi:MAG: ketoacyl-ACP synthase III [Cyclobacteriaceae bacterium]|nr:ketoacyl-ACP synthase III [Cyclobacteriaceae bacterium]MCH8515903.1 ketoacyl-ACP synthase III [Cyclobacteriaceae bacterium]